MARLAEDHANARRLAEGAVRVPGLSVAVPAAHTPTNMVFLHVDTRLGTAQRLAEALATRGVLALALDPQRLRFVTHLDVRAADIERTIEALQASLPR